MTDVYILLVNHTLSLSVGKKGYNNCCNHLSTKLSHCAQHQCLLRFLSPFFPFLFPSRLLLFLLGSQANVVSNVMCSVDEEVELIDRSRRMGVFPLVNVPHCLQFLLSPYINAIGQRQKSRQAYTCKCPVLKSIVY